MSAATAIYTLGEYESFECHKCGVMNHGGADMEITVEPDGETVIIRCENCPTVELKGGHA